MKMTVLEIVQNILSALDGDEVNSIGDTIESEQIAHEVRNTYYEHLNNFGIAGRNQLVQFDALNSYDDYPNVLKVVDTVDHFDWIKYNTNTVDDPEYKDVDYLEPKEFMDRVLMGASGTSITVKDIITQLPYKIVSDKAPEFWTTFDNEHIVFNSINRELDDTLQQSKLMAYGEVLPSFSLVDDFVPDMEAKMFSGFISEAKAACFVNYKGVSNAKEEQRARRQKVRYQANNSKRHNGSNYKINFGRS